MTWTPTLRLLMRHAVAVMALATVFTVQAELPKEIASHALPLLANPCVQTPCEQVASPSAMSMHAAPVGYATRSLLRMQASGAHASAHTYPMQGDVASKVYERYVNSFAHPIAEKSATTLSQSER